MQQLNTLCRGDPFNPTLGRWNSKIPWIASSLPLALCIKLPKALTVVVVLAAVKDPPGVSTHTEAAVPVIQCNSMDACHEATSPVCESSSHSLDKTAVELEGWEEGVSAMDCEYGPTEMEYAPTAAVPAAVKDPPDRMIYKLHSKACSSGCTEQPASRDINVVNIVESVGLPRMHVEAARTAAASVAVPPQERGQDTSAKSGILRDSGILTARVISKVLSKDCTFKYVEQLVLLDGGAVMPMRLPNTIDKPTVEFGGLEVALCQCQQLDQFTVVCDAGMGIPAVLRVRVPRVRVCIYCGIDTRGYSTITAVNYCKNPYPWETVMVSRVTEVCTLETLSGTSRMVLSKAPASNPWIAPAPSPPLLATLSIPPLIDRSLHHEDSVFQLVLRSSAPAPLVIDEPVVKLRGLHQSAWRDQDPVIFFKEVRTSQSSVRASDPEPPLYLWTLSIHVASESSALSAVDQHINNALREKKLAGNGVSLHGCCAPTLPTPALDVDGAAVDPVKTRAIELGG
ncbi:hypothetical protein B0H13DRAFT_1859031 [Mycena leptocephala]|nr:hypothetical protein B0H13DRAFT_1859031 [Mycena leptocephala]